MANLDVPSKRCKSVETPLSRDLRLKMEVSELLADVNDFLWQYYGRPQYVIRKLHFCPWTILREDLEQIKAILERAPNTDQLAKCRQLVMAQATQENKNKLEQLERGIESVKKVKEHLVELVARVQNQLSTTGNISPSLSTVKSISAVKFATVGVNNSNTCTNMVKSSLLGQHCCNSAGLPTVVAKSIRKMYTTTGKQPSSTEMVKKEVSKVVFKDKTTSADKTK